MPCVRVYCGGRVVGSCGQILMPVKCCFLIANHLITGMYFLCEFVTINHSMAGVVCCSASNYVASNANIIMMSILPARKCLHVFF